MAFPRALTTREREVLALLLPTDGFPDVGVYHAQLDETTVSGRCECGCATVHLDVAPGAPRATFDRPNAAPLPIEAQGQDPSDPSLPVQVLLFAREGALDSLEIVYFGDTPPREFPDVQSLEALKLRQALAVARREERRVGLSLDLALWTTPRSATRLPADSGAIG